ncbi:MAG: CpsB/CapC family capsule biosynthesis tyrosine phosphatase [Proteocatella sp.]
MIDVHAHIIPGVDDGPQKLEEAMEMIAMASEDGIEAIICTPHRNHPGDFALSHNIEEAYEKLKAAVSEKYPQMQLHLGCELYISKNYLEILDQKPYPLTMPGNRYMLAEFPRNIKIGSMMDVVHEIKIRGYVPVIAHIEMYPDIIEQISNVKSLRAEGAYIQITASSLLGKQGSKTASTLKKLIALGQIDFIATDGHSPTSRRPLLSKAHDYVSRNYGKKIAQAIFCTNPAAMISNQELPSNPLAVKKRRTYMPRLNLVAATCAAIVIGTGTMLFLTEKDVALAAYIGDIKSNQQATQEQKTEDAESKAKEQSDSEVKEAEKPTAQEVEIKSENQKQDIKPQNQQTQSQIVSKYTQKLKGMQQGYEGGLVQIIDQIDVARNTIKDPEEKKRIIDNYITDIGNLESNSDNDVYQALYDMQNELEAVTDNVDSVQQLRDQYQQIKSEKKAYYIDAFQ